MSTVTAGEIVDRAALALFDETSVRWTPEELLKYLSDGQREIVGLKPSANPVRETVKLVEGAAQSVPSAGTTLIKLVCNMGTDGDTPGRAIRDVNMATLDATRPNWRAETAAAEVIHYMFDDRDPRNFDVTPPQPSSNQGYVDMIYAAAPEEIDDTETTIELDDIYAPLLGYYVMARALAKQSGEGDPNAALRYYEMFIKGVTGKYDVDMKLHPLQATDRTVR